jgi:hypothetical protein
MTIGLARPDIDHIELIELIYLKAPCSSNIITD